jgi:hypothetical protein
MRQTLNGRGDPLQPAKAYNEWRSEIRQGPRIGGNPKSSYEHGQGSKR